MAADESAKSSTDLLKDLGGQIDDLRIILDKVSPLVIMVQGTLETLSPLLKTLSWFRSKYDFFVDILQQDLPDTKETRELITNYIYKLEKHVQNVNVFIVEVKTNMEKGSMPKISTLIDDDAPNMPTKNKIHDSMDKQRGFVGAIFVCGLFALPSAKYALERSMPKKHTVTRSIVSDATTVVAFSLLSGALGSLMIDQDFKDGAKLGLKISLCSALAGDAIKLARYAVVESGLVNLLPKPVQNVLNY
jgi:hypothetical protein